MRIAYGKLGRSIPLTYEDASNVGGDIEVVHLLDRMLFMGHEVHLVGRNRGDEYRLTHNLFNHWAPGGILYGDKGPPAPSRSRDPAFDTYDHYLKKKISALPKMDAWIIWLGQHGSSVHPVPAVQEGKIGTFTNPMGSDVNYAYPLVAMVNELNVQPVWLCPDPRNMVKFRDLWNPKQPPILAQYDTSKDNTFYDERDGQLRKGSTRYVYAGIELLAVPNISSVEDRGRRLDNPPDRPFGVLVNEGYNNLGQRGRLHLVKTWLKDIEPYELFGTWSESSQKTLGRVIEPVALDAVMPTMQRWRATITFPATGTGWATAKPWEAFNAGCVCIAHPGYDDQDHIYSKSAMGEKLYSFLRPRTYSGLKDRLAQLQDNHTWMDIVCLQYDYLDRAVIGLGHGAGMITTALKNLETIKA